MSAIPGNLVRVPTMLSSNFQLGAINRASVDLVKLQQQLASGDRISRPSDDVIGAGALSILEDRIEKRSQSMRNLEHARGALDTLDASIGDLSEILLEAKGLASSQIGAGSDAETRRSQAAIVDMMISELSNIGNRKYQLIHLFGGDQTSRPPFEDLLGGVRYVGGDRGLVTDLPVARSIELTLSGEDAFGAISSRQKGQRDLDPAVGMDSLLQDLNGARGLGVTRGAIQVDVDGTDLTVDLSQASTVGDVVTALEAALQEVDPSITVSLAAGKGISINSPFATVTISDQAAPSTAADLGLAGSFSPPDGTGSDLDARITDLTRLDSFLSASAPLGSLRLENLGRVREVDLDSIGTVQELRNAVSGLDIGIRVEISEDGRSLDFINEVSGGWMSVGEVGGGTAASMLGVRTFARDTPLEVFNDGRGVNIISGNTDPLTGEPDPSRDVDFTIRAKDGTEVDVDLAGSTTVGDVLDRMETAIAAAGLSGQMSVGLAADGNGIMIEDQTAGGTGVTEVLQRNASFAADDLGIRGRTEGATLAGEDRARVAADGLITRLIRLRDALLANDERGITLAGEGLDEDVSRIAEVRADIGVRSRRLATATEREEDLRILDQSLASDIRDLDFSEAAVRFSLLQQQLQAGLSSASRLVQISLLDFLR
ncbi:MAG: flagellin [Planctomycetota bacterium]|jgi:flagellin-like hook-associated protein FlgL